MSFEDFVKSLKINLTDKQKEAVQAPLGPVIVHAGAGSGKTSVIAHRFIHLIQHCKIKPEKILLVTFTNQAVRNIQNKIKGYLMEWTHMSVQEMEHIHNNIHAMTFHGLCMRMLEWIYDKKDKAAATKFTYDSHFFPLVKEVLKGYPNIRAAYNVKAILLKLRWICKFQNRDFTEDDLVDIAMNVDVIYQREKILKKYPLKEMREIYDKFDELMKKKKMGTLDDILLESNRYLVNDESIVKEWSSRYDAILCDEFQDVDEIQFNLLLMLSHRHSNLFCVGDPNQTIYGFRGSVPQVFTKLRKHFMDQGKEVHWKQLPENFRSTPQILATANALMNVPQVPEELRNPLVTQNPDGSRPTIRLLTSDNKQAQVVAAKIIELSQQGVKLSDIAVLARKRVNYQRIKHEFLSQQIHYEDYREVLPLIKGEAIKDLISWISVAFVREDDNHWFSYFKRIYNKPPSGVGPTTLQKITQKFKEQKRPIMDILAEETAFNDKLSMLLWKIKRMIDVADDQSLPLIERYRKIANESGLLAYYEKKHGKDSEKMDVIEKFLQSPLISDSESWKDALARVENYLNLANQERVVCSTIHGVKGLEFKHVFLLSLSEGHIPASRGLRLCKDEKAKQEYVEDERRVLYVAITRAKECLYLFTDSSTPSQFLDDIRSTLDGEMKDVSDDQREKHIKDTMKQHGDDGGEDDDTPIDVL